MSKESPISSLKLSESGQVLKTILQHTPLFADFNVNSSSEKMVSFECLPEKIKMAPEGLICNYLSNSSFC